MAHSIDSKSQKRKRDVNDAGMQPRHPLNQGAFVALAKHLGEDVWAVRLRSKQPGGASDGSY